MNPTQELIPAPRPGAEVVEAADPAAMLAYPVEIIPSVVQDRLLGIIERALETVVTADTLQEASERAQVLHSVIKGQDDRVTELRRPLKALADRISEESKQGMALAVRVVGELDAKIKAHLLAKRQEAEAAQREAARIAAEAEAKRQEAIRAEARAKAEAEAKRQEAERRRFEAEEQERLAAEALTQGKRTAEVVADGAAQLEASAKKEADARAAQAEADEIERLAAEAKAKADAEIEELNRQARAKAVEVLSAPTQGTAKLKQVPALDSVDLALLPPAYRLADEAKIKKALGMGLEVEGVKWHFEDDLRQARRAR